jgi:hypothetical protein
MATPERPVALITVFSDAALQRILGEIAAGPSPQIARWFVGTFGVNRAAAERIVAVPACAYAPVFGVQPDTSMQARMRRQLSPAETSRVGDAAHAGEIPGSSAGQVIPPGDRRAWGIELGRRFRDALRAARAQGIPIGTWQFDEVLGECGQPGSSNPHREFVGGVLRGLAQGRPALGDTPEKGFVWTARTAVTRLPNLPIAGDLQLFWEDFDAAALFLVGEEYPPFRGDPAVVARRFSDGHRALVDSSGTIRRSLGNRYVVGMTPGWRRATGGGNVDGKPLADVTRWRQGFIDGRIAAQRPRGFGQFNFVVENTRPNRVEDAVRSLHHAARQHGA